MNKEENKNLLKRLVAAYKWGTSLECDDIIKEVESFFGTTIEKEGSLSQRLKSEEITKKVIIRKKKKK